MRAVDVPEIGLLAGNIKGGRGTSRDKTASIRKRIKFLKVLLGLKEGDLGHSG